MENKQGMSWEARAGFAGVFVAVVLAAIPIIYYCGQITKEQQTQSSVLEAHGKKMDKMQDDITDLKVGFATIGAHSTASTGHRTNDYATTE